jgi:hypothetical protein
VGSIDGRLHALEGLMGISEAEAGKRVRAEGERLRLLAELEELERERGKTLRERAEREAAELQRGIAADSTRLRTSRRRRRGGGASVGLLGAG